MYYLNTLKFGYTMIHEDRQLNTHKAHVKKISQGGYFIMFIRLKIILVKIILANRRIICE